MIKVLIVEDQDVIRESFNIVLSARPEIEIVGLAKDGLEGVALTSKTLPDVVLLDVRMPNMDGVTACKIIKREHPSTKVIILTTFDDDEYVVNSIKYGANGYLLKGVSVDELVSAIKTVYNDGTLLNPIVASKLITFFADMVTPFDEELTTTSTSHNIEIELISKRENEIVKQIVNGLSNKEIAKSLFLSEGTVRNSISNILNKLQLRDRTQLVLYYVNKAQEEK
jgi:Response regulator containing a CheY-like receiver domain and an HTH DNA-binding domain